MSLVRVDKDTLTQYSAVINADKDAFVCERLLEAIILREKEGKQGTATYVVALSLLARLV